MMSIIYAFGEITLLLCILTFLTALLKENQLLTLFHLNGTTKNLFLVSNKEELQLYKLENYHQQLVQEMLVLNTLEIGFWESKVGLVWLFPLMEAMESPKDLFFPSLLLAV